MKPYLLLCFLLLGFLRSSAQALVLSVGSASAPTIKSGTAFSPDSLVLTPGADLTLNSNSVSVTPAAVNMVSNLGINRVYYFGSQVMFTGTVQVYYEPPGLDGTSEATL